MTEETGKKVLYTQEVVGKHVITVQGEDLGVVERILVNPETAAVAGLTLSAKGWFKGEKAVEFGSVKAIGGYAVTLENSELVVALNSAPALEQLANQFNLYGSRVITPQGELMGTVDDFAFDTVTGTIESFLLSGGLIKNLTKGKASVPMSAVEKIGPDVIVTNETAPENLIKNQQGLSDNIGSLKENMDHWRKNIDSLKDDVEKGWDITLGTAKEVSKGLGEKLIEVTGDSKEKSMEILSKTATKTVGFLSKSKTDLVGTYEHWVDKLANYKNRNTLSSDELSSLLWKKVGRPIYDADGNLLIDKDAEVTPEILDKIQQANKTKELLLSIATRDVAEKLETIEKEGEDIAE